MISAQPGRTQTADPNTARQDWVLASAQMQAQNPAQALPYLERLVRDYPDVVFYRLELGYALYLLGRDVRASYHFQQARGANLTPVQRRAVDNALANIADRKVWAFRFSFNIEPATNAGKGTAASSVDLGGLIFSIPDTLQTRPATGVLLTGGVTYRPKITEKLDAVLSFDTLIKYYDEEVLRETVVIGRAGLRYELRQNTFVEGGAFTGVSFQAGARYSDRVGAYASYTTPLGKRASARFDMEHYRITHDTFALADGPRTRIGAQFAYAINPQAILRARGYVLHMDATSPLQSGWQGAIAFGGTYAFKGGLVAMVDMTFGRDKRDGINGLTGQRRLDTSRAIEAQFFNSKYQIGRFLPVLQMKFEENRSNEVLNSYTNRSIGLGFRTSF